MGSKDFVISDEMYRDAIIGDCLFFLKDENLWSNLILEAKANESSKVLSARYNLSVEMINELKDVV